MVSLGEIIYRLNENTMLRAVKKSDLINHIKDFMVLIGAPGLYKDATITLEIIDFRAQLPKDFIKRNTVHRILLNSAGNTGSPRPVTLGHNPDDFYNTYSEQSSNGKTIDPLYTHKIVGDFIYVDFKEGMIQMAYSAIQTDEKGYPLVNAGVNFRLAAEWYVKKIYYTIAWEMGQLPDKVLQNTEQQYAWAVGRAHSEINIPDPVEAEAIGNMLVRLIPISEGFATDHRYDGQQERLRNHAPYR
jgi:hypothetical protein